MIFMIEAQARYAMQAIAAGPLTTDSLLQQLAQHVLSAIALVLPALDRITRTDWLLYGVPETSSFLLGISGALLYAVLLAAAGVFDFQRRTA